MLDFIVNPIAGGKDGKKMIKSLSDIERRLAERNVAYSIHVTKGKNDAKKLTSELIANGATDIIAVGGDGTLHEVINGFTNFENTRLGLIPCGTGNDFANAINLPLDVKKAVDIILDNDAKYTDFMQLPTIRGINIVGMGIDVDVLKRYEALKKKTKFAYTKCLVKTLLNFNYIDFEAEFNEERKPYRSFIACIANGHRYGGGIEICPVAKPYDNKLDFMAIKNMTKLGIVGAFIKLKKGKIMTLPQVIHDNMNEVKIYPKGDYTVNVDGELYDNIPFEVKIVSNTLKMYRP